jgi:hypothetical protein
MFFGGENAHSGDRKRHSGMWCLAGYPSLSIARMGVFTAKEHSWNAFDASRAG